jgi:hypothetical protein
MLSPKASDRIVFLPQDHEIMGITGMSEDQYRWFVRQAILHSKLRPGEPVAFEPITFLVTLVIGLALSYLSSLLQKTPKQPKSVESRDVQGQTIVRGDEYAPKAGFDSVQNVVQLGSTIPLIYSNRQVIDGVAYGGIRVNTNLLWSQIYSVGGGQMLRAIFLVGEGTENSASTGMALQADQFAIGNNLISGYELSSIEAGRISIYYSNDTGRISQFDYLSGVKAENDLGNAQQDGAKDVYEVRSDNNEYKPDFCMVFKPSTQIVFGVSGFIGNGFSYRVNPTFKPAQILSNSGEDVKCKLDRQETCQRSKQNYAFPGRGGLIGTPGLQLVSSGQRLTYKLNEKCATNDCHVTSHQGVSWNDGILTIGNGELTLGDVSNAVAARQRAWDQLINIGDLYKLGSALAICVGRTSFPFTSDAASDPVGGGQAVEATFEVISGGQVHLFSDNDIRVGSFNGGLNATESSHVMRCSVGTFVTEKRGRSVEIGIRSSLQINLGGICNFGDCQSYEVIDGKACEYFDGESLSSSKPVNFVNGSYTGAEERYSFFTIEWRVAGDGSGYERINCGFGVRSVTGVAVYNYIRFEFPLSRRYEFRIVPLSGWEVRNGYAPTTLAVLDYAVDAVQSFNDPSSVVRIQYSGEEVPMNTDTFAIQMLSPRATEIANVDTANMISGSFYQPGTYTVELEAVNNAAGTGATAQIVVASGGVVSFTLQDRGTYYNVGDRLQILNPTLVVGLIDPTVPITQVFEIRVSEVRKIDLGNGFDDGEYYGDAYAKLAEAFIYNEITSSATQPEHVISYVNNVTPNPVAPDYEGLAIVGLNIRASTEINNLQQFSVYVNKGLQSTSQFPDVLYDLMTSKRYGTGALMSPVQIDRDSFIEANDFTMLRRYFFDGAIVEKVNIRSWGAERARDYLLDLVIQNGKFALQPVASFYGPEKILALYSAGNIIEDSFEISYFDPIERIPPQVSVTWREERAASNESGNGLFPSTREVLVREKEVGDQAPLEQFDLSDFCTSEKQAIDRGKWECRFRRLVTHSVKFKTTPSEAALTIGGCFKLGLETVTFEQPQNGAIAANGTVTSWPPIADGTYQVLLWDGQNSAVENTALIIAGGVANRSNAVFCLSGSAANVQTYKTQSLSFDEEGNIEIEALYWPTDNEGNSLLTQNFDNDEFWDLKGLIES